MQDLCVAVGLYLSIRRYFVWQFPAIKVTAQITAIKSKNFFIT